MLSGALFAIIEEAGAAVLILTEEVEREEFLASRLTRAEARRQLLVMADMLAEVGAGTRQRMPELEWAGWQAMARALRGEDANPDNADEALWFAIRSLVPATVMWLRVYRKSQPELFSFIV